MRIFWSWQSDTHQSSGRNFIRGVLTDLVTELNVGAEDAERPDADDEPGESHIRVDHDTLGVAGSPPIAETILRKISEAAVFVADVTPVGKTAGGKRLSNPNVMIELGYAMHVLGHKRIVLVMNQVDGAALRHLPFDLRHWRAPVTYSLGKDATEEQQLEVAAALKDELRERIEPSLTVAERTMREDRRRIDRAPDLRVELDRACGAGPIYVSQQVKSLGVKSLDEIKKEVPLHPVSSAFAARAQLSAALDYNRSVESYYQKYSKYLDKVTDYVRLTMRVVEIKLLLANRGTLPATNIDVDIALPSGLVPYNDKGGCQRLPVLPCHRPWRGRPQIRWTCSPTFYHASHARHGPFPTDGACSFGRLSSNTTTRSLSSRS